MGICPHSADVLTGHVFPLRFLGATAYLTKSQDRVLDTMNLSRLTTLLVFTLWAYWKDDKEESPNLSTISRRFPNERQPE